MSPPPYNHTNDGDVAIFIFVLMKIRLICRRQWKDMCLRTKDVVGDGIRLCSRLGWVKISLQSQFLPNPTVLKFFLKEDEDFKAMGYACFVPGFSWDLFAFG
ncbi:unnamed protein product [Lactuca virosa]|uniref:Uncharacterized protein n=1 Tax=Lactuca virosa TaxID=75947 RepID=A0AAU9NGF6_9ASTR|nr:unnamed protein product [Lactuca virosa]